MIERIVSLGADYASTLGALARTEALDDVAGLRRALRARIAAALVLAGEVGARLHAIRKALRETVTLHRGPQGEPVEPPSGLRFEPRSRTLRGLMWLWRVIPRVPSGTALASALGMLAVNSPGLRRLLAAMALLTRLVSTESR